MLSRLTERKSLSPALIIMGGFILISLLGAGLLATPWVTQSQEGTPFLDAWFTAVSAVCVTGNVTVNTLDHWNIWGWTVILCLIEVGGLGFMTLWVTIYVFMGKRVDLRAQQVVLESLNISDLSQVHALLSYILRFAMTAQGIGAFLLAWAWVPEHGWGMGLYHAVFHSVSAFCNAGFDLFGESLVGYQDHPLVVLTITALIVIGGLGFIVCRDLLAYPKNHQLLWHSKIVLSATGFLLLGGTLLFAWTEHGTGLLDRYPAGIRWMNYLFLAVTPRTAGYATIDYTHLSHAGILLTLILMFIGASSGSTGGGLKTTTVVVLIVQAFSGVRSRGAMIFKRGISREAMVKAVFMFTAGMLLISLASFILLSTEQIPAGFGLEYILMEVVSCFSTVGLSLGLSANLTAIGKVVLIVMMLIGRIGLLTVFWAINLSRTPSKVKHPLGNLMIG